MMRLFKPPGEPDQWASDAGCLFGISLVSGGAYQSRPRIIFPAALIPVQLEPPFASAGLIYPCS